MRPHPEQGGAFIVSVFLMAIVTLLAIGVVSTATVDLKISDNYARSMRSFYAAEAGANKAVALLEADGAVGDLAPYPTGTPLVTGSLGANSYSIWLWNRRVSGNGAVSEFPAKESRQFIAAGSDSRGARRRLEGVIEPVRDGPTALDRAIFTCGAASLTSGTIDGNVYARGDVTFGANCGSVVNIESRGQLTNSTKVNGNATTSGAIHNNSDLIKGVCKTASATIDQAGNCGSVLTNVSPNPAKDYCNVASADWDPEMLKFTSVDIGTALLNTPGGDRHMAGWTPPGNLALGDQNYYVTGGDANFQDIDVTYTGNTVLVVDGTYNFNCNKCSIEAAAGAPGWSQLVIITRAGNITFTDVNKNTCNITGVLWAGVTDAAGVLPAAGSITVSDKMTVLLNGEAVALGGPIQVVGANAKLTVERGAAVPPVFGGITGYRISEWLELR